MGNITANETNTYSSSYQITTACTYGLLSVLIIGGNSMCLLVLRQTSDLKTPTKLFLISLTCADLLMGLTYTFPRFLSASLQTLLPLTVQPGVCFVTSLISGYFAFMSTMSLLAVNVDRYLAIEAPLKSMTIITSRRAKIGTTCTWISGAMLITSYLFFVDASYFDFSKKTTCDVFIQIRYDLSGVITVSLGFVFFNVLPFILIIVIYARIAIIVRRLKLTASKLRASTAFRYRSCRHDDHKALKRFLLVTLVSTMTWTPNYAYIYATLYHESLSSQSYIKLTANAIGLCNNWINIFIYTVKDRRFRKSAMKLLVHFRNRDEVVLSEMTSKHK